MARDARRADRRAGLTHHLSPPAPIDRLTADRASSESIALSDVAVLALGLALILLIAVGVRRRIGGIPCACGEQRLGRPLRPGRRDQSPPGPAPRRAARRALPTCAHCRGRRAGRLAPWLRRPATRKTLRKTTAAASRAIESTMAAR